MKIIIASMNNAKIEGCKKAFLKYFNNVEIEGISVESYVSEQPMNEEIMMGVKNRIQGIKGYCEEVGLEADYYCAIESGLTDSIGNIDEWLNISIAGIEDNEGRFGYGTSAGFPIPLNLVSDILEKDLAQVVKDKFNYEGDNGSISYLTDEVITRIDLTEEAFVMALIPLLKKKWK